MPDAWTSLLRREPWLALDLVRRVGRGMALLDEHDPGWIMRVDPRVIDQATTRHDVLGQLHGTYLAGCNAVLTEMRNDATDGPSSRGFTLRFDEQFGPEPPVLARFAALTALWRREVVARRIAAAEKTTTITV